MKKDEGNIHLSDVCCILYACDLHYSPQESIAIPISQIRKVRLSEGRDLFLSSFPPASRCSVKSKPRLQFESQRGRLSLPFSEPHFSHPKKAIILSASLEFVRIK